MTSTEGQVEDRERRLECAGRSLAAALLEEDPKTLAALLRAAAKYIEGEAAGSMGSLPAASFSAARGEARR